MEREKDAVEGRVVHCKREDYDVYIGRPSKWGNPFVIGRDGTREQVIEKYRQWVEGQPDLLRALPELKGKRLGCWCAPHRCHGDVLREMADRQREQKRGDDRRASEMGFASQAQWRARRRDDPEKER